MAQPGVMVSGPGAESHPIPPPRLLRMLADGNFHSGEELGEAMGVSRTAVWKQLKRLEGLGITVESVKGIGYRIAGGLDLLDKQVIEESLCPQVRRWISNLEVHASLPSTNDLAMEYAQRANARGAILLAEQQTAGRGRRGRKWVSPFARNLYLSVVWGYEQGTAVLDGLSLSVGVAVRRALARNGIEGVGLKWPNDLLARDRKLGGILLEITGDPSDLCQVVVGVGINVDMPVEGAAAIDQEWIDLKSFTGNSIPRNHLAAAVIDELVALLSGYQATGFAPYRDEWLAGDVHRDRAVILSTPTSRRRGIARGVDDKGALLLEIDGRVEACLGGEISLRVDDLVKGDT